MPRLPPAAAIRAGSRWTGSRPEARPAPPDGGPEAGRGGAATRHRPLAHSRLSTIYVSADAGQGRRHQGSGTGSASTTTEGPLRASDEVTTPGRFSKLVTQV